MLTSVVLLFEQRGVDYLSRRGVWVPYSESANRVGALEFWVLLTSMLFAVIGLCRESPAWVSLIALVLAGLILVATGMTA